MTKTRKRRILRSLVVNEVSGVDKAAQVPADVVLRKRAPEGESATRKFIDDFSRPVLTTATDGHQHVIDDCGPGGETTWTRSDGDEYGHSHPWVRNLDGTITIGVADGHTHQLEDANKSAGASGGGPDNGVNDMTNQPDKTAADANAEAVTKMKAENDELTKRAERAESIAKMSADERSYFDGLGETDQDSFLAKSAADRATAIREAQEADRVVYKSASGDVYRASDDPRLVKMAQERDADREAIQKANDEATNARLTKRVSEEMAHCPGDEPTRVGILKALEGVEGAAEFIKAADAALAKSFTPSGTTGTTSDTEELAKAEDKLDALAKAHAEEHNVSYAKAYDAVLSTPEGSKLYAETAN